MRTRKSLPVTVLLSVLLVVIIVLGACGTRETEFVVKDLRQAPGARSVSTYPVSNAGDSALVQDVPAPKTFSHTVQTGNLSTNVNEQTVRTRIYSFYNITKIDDSRSCGFTANVGPHKTNEYDVEWVETWREGVIIEGSSGSGAQLGTYRMLEGLDCQIVALRVRNN